MTEFRNVPTRKWAEPTVKMIDEKSILPAKIPINGLMILETKDLTMAVNADPTMTPTAKSITFPRAINSLNSLSIESPFPIIKVLNYFNTIHDAFF